MNIIKELPEIFEEFAEQKKQSFLLVKECKDRHIPVIGAYCSYFPRELAAAMGAIPIGLCSSSEETVKIAHAAVTAAITPLMTLRAFRPNFAFFIDTHLKIIIFRVYFTLFLFI